MNKFFNLRFIIGLFFLLIGVVLVVYSFSSSPANTYSHTINLYCGLLLAGFGMIMLASFIRFSKDKNN